MAVFLVIACLASGAFLFEKTGVVEERGVLGGPGSPRLLASAEGAGFDKSPALAAKGMPGTPTSLLGGNGFVAENVEIISAAQSVSMDAAAMKDMGTAAGPALGRGGMISYTIQSGDNLSRIATYFGISIDTIISANPAVKAKSLRVGDTLNILPVSGVVYTARSGDTLESIANAFGVTTQKLLQFNGSINFSKLSAGMAVIIPGGKNLSGIASVAKLPNFNSEFIIPADGYNWGTLHHENGIDIANSCGTPIVAAAEGLVVPDKSTENVLNGWNGGYGNFVFIEHPFGNTVRTRYAHLQKTSVQIGDYVKQGQAIGLMGQTGEATGCHLHFEVLGAQNPFLKK